MSPALWTQLRTGEPAPGSEEVVKSMDSGSRFPTRTNSLASSSVSGHLPVQLLEGMKLD